MLSRSDFSAAQRQAAAMIKQAGIQITGREAERIEVADFGLGRLEVEGAQILTLVATDRLGVKILALLPSQTVPEHWHPPVGEDPGKEETVRVISGTVHFYTPGKENISTGSIPQGKDGYYTARQEVVMKPGDQITLKPGTKHWFQAGTVGAVMYSFSTVARDVLDGFTDPGVERITKIQD